MSYDYQSTVGGNGQEPNNFRWSLLSSVLASADSRAYPFILQGKFFSIDPAYQRFLSPSASQNLQKLQVLSPVEIDYVRQMIAIKPEPSGMEALAVASTNVMARSRPIDVDNRMVVDFSARVPTPSMSVNEELRAQYVEALPAMTKAWDDVTEQAKDVLVSIMKAVPVTDPENAEFMAIAFLEQMKMKSPDLNTYRGHIGTKLSELHSMKHVRDLQRLEMSLPHPTMGCPCGKCRVNGVGPFLATNFSPHGVSPMPSASDALINEMARTIGMYCVIKWGVGPKPQFIEVYLFSKLSKGMSTLMEVYSRLLSVVREVKFDPLKPELYMSELEAYAEKVIADPAPLGDLVRVTVPILKPVPSVSPLMESSKLKFGQAKFNLLVKKGRFLHRDFAFTSVHVVNKGPVLTYPLELQSEYVKLYVLEAESDLPKYVDHCLQAYKKLPGTMHCASEMVMILHSILPSELVEYMHFLYRACSESRKLKIINGDSEEQIGVSGRPSKLKEKVWGGKVPPRFSTPRNCPIGFIYNSKLEIQYGPPRGGVYYYIACPVVDDGSMKCRITYGLPSGRIEYKTKYNSPAVSLVVGKNPCQVRDNHTPPMSPEHWTVFRFFLQRDLDEAAFATVFNDDCVFGSVKLSDARVSLDRREGTDVVFVTKKRIITECQVSSGKLVWLSGEDKFVEVKGLNENLPVISFGSVAELSK